MWEIPLFRRPIRPSTIWLICFECSRITKHLSRINYLASIPIIERLIECFCSMKHRIHISYLTSIPIIERLIECIRSLEHTSHISYLASIPIIERLIECSRISKHRFHISYLTSIPIIERLLECTCSIKHLAHSSYLTSIPIIERLIECYCSIEHTLHSSYLASIPVSYILVERTIPMEHMSHISYSRSYNPIRRVDIICNFCLNIIFPSSNIVFLSLKQIFFTSFSTVCSFDGYSIGVSIDRIWTIYFTDISSSIIFISTLTPWTSFIWSTIESIAWLSVTMRYSCLSWEGSCRTSI